MEHDKGSCPIDLIPAWASSIIGKHIKPNSHSFERSDSDEEAR